MVASKLLGVVGIIFLMANYSPGNGRCLKAPIGGGPCPPTWSQWQDKCYKMYDGQVTWQEGKGICVEMGGVMVVSQSQEELKHLLKTYGSVFWIGCNDIDVEGTWVCLDGAGTINETDMRWNWQEPDNHNGKEDCAAAVQRSGWHDRRCDGTYKLICKRPVS